MKCIACEKDTLVNNEGMCDICYPKFVLWNEQRGYEGTYQPTQEEVESMHEDMMDPALFGELAIPEGYEFPERRINGHNSAEIPEDFSF